MHRLPCLFLGCPVRFRSQHGRTYHTHAVHTRFHNHVADPQDNELDLDSDGHSTELTGRLGSLAQRIEHPHLTGMCAHVVFE